MAKKLSLFQRIKQALFGTPKKTAPAPTPAPKPTPRPAPAPAPAPTPGPSMQTLYNAHQQHIAEVEARVAAYAALPPSRRRGANRPDDEEALFWRLYEGAVE